LLTCEQLAQEIAEKLGERGIDDAVIEHYIATLAQLAEWITVSSESVVPVLPDPDDDVVLACAVLGRATHLVTYDPHFDILNGNYQEITILKALPFLWIVRGDKKPADE